MHAFVNLKSIKQYNTIILTRDFQRNRKGYCTALYWINDHFVRISSRSKCDWNILLNVPFPVVKNEKKKKLKYNTIMWLRFKTKFVNPAEKIQTEYGTSLKGEWSSIIVAVSLRVMCLYLCGLMTAPYMACLHGCCCRMSSARLYHYTVMPPYTAAMSTQMSLPAGLRLRGHTDQGLWPAANSHWLYWIRVEIRRAMIW